MKGGQKWLQMKTRAIYSGIACTTGCAMGGKTEDEKKLADAYEIAQAKCTEMLESIQGKGHNMQAILVGALEPLLYVAHRCAPNSKSVTEIIKEVNEQMEKAAEEARIERKK